MDRRLYQYCCLQLIHQFNTSWKYLQQNLGIFLFHSITGKSIWVLFISNLWLSRCPLHRAPLNTYCASPQLCKRRDFDLWCNQRLQDRPQKCSWITSSLCFPERKAMKTHEVVAWALEEYLCQSRLLSCLLYFPLRACSFPQSQLLHAPKQQASCTVSMSYHYIMWAEICLVWGAMRTHIRAKRQLCPTIQVQTRPDPARHFNIPSI